MVDEIVSGSTLSKFRTGCDEPQIVLCALRFAQILLSPGSVRIESSSCSVSMMLLKGEKQAEMTVSGPCSVSILSAVELTVDWRNTDLLQDDGEIIPALLFLEGHWFQDLGIPAILPSSIYGSWTRMIEGLWEFLASNKAELMQMERLLIQSEILWFSVQKPQKVLSAGQWVAACSRDWHLEHFLALKNSLTV
ncbi:hypothetical protein AVEN_260948-1 [Araneus ventricosus]|uniref:Uncharacterized protein n=1 Tax=Araneus ventricosus TaxID=182803 RepID=A0A4Y2KF96_ARAVE|nr:hypothetical protein AVEN_260948-1 [Araneus ventricosus]